MAYDHGGIKALKPKPSGGRKRENMLAEEKTLLRRFAKAAGAGEMSNIHDLKAAYAWSLPSLESANLEGPAPGKELEPDSKSFSARAPNSTP